MRLLFYVGHPAHYHLLKNAMKQLQDAGADIVVLSRAKDVLQDLLDAAGLPTVNIQPRRRTGSKSAMIAGMVERAWKMYKKSRQFRPDILIGTSAEVAQIGRVLGRPSIVLNEDDVDVVPLFARAAYPFASSIFSPAVCRAGRWDYKKCGYPGYQKLAYLHPNQFAPDRERVRHLYVDRDRFFIVRLVQLTAHHDAGITGIGRSVLRRLIQLLEPHGRVHISAEGHLDEEFVDYRLDINPLDIHHALYFSDLYVGDSQSMTVEAAVLGTPGVRFNDFAGRISVLEELEHKYRLTTALRSSEEERLLDIVRSYVDDTSTVARWRERREVMLREKVDVTALLVWFITNYPYSHDLLRSEPDSIEQYL